MKKFLHLMVLSVFLVSLCTTGVSAQVITVDGQKDAFFDALTGPEDGFIQLMPYNHSAVGPMPDGVADLSAKIWGAWDEDYLYLYAEVTDDIISLDNAAGNNWQTDAMELKIDGIPDDSTQAAVSSSCIFTAIDSSDAADADKAVCDNITAFADEDKMYARGELDGGYILEYAIKLDTLGGSEKIDAVEGGVFGLGINLIDNDGNSRQGAEVWAAECDDMIWSTVKLHGTVKFLADNKVEFLAANNMTGKANPLAFDGSVPPIVVDGQKDYFYSELTGPDDGYLQLKSYAFNDNGIPEGDADLSAQIWFAWDEEWLYMYEEVKDDTISMSSPNTYNNDGLEFKVDPSPTDSVANSTFGLEMTAVYDTTETGAAESGHSNMALADSVKQFARTLTDDGYALELAVKWSAITAGTPAETIEPVEGNIFGMAVQNHDNDNTLGNRDATVQWAAVLADAAWNTPKYDGTVKFLADQKLQFIPSNNMTGVTNMIPYDGTPFYMRIDGQKDPFYSQLAGPDDGYLQLRSYAYNDNGAPDDDADLSAKIWTAWDDEWFYLYEEVKDDTISMSSANSYNNDGFEMKIDPVATDSVANSIWGLEMTAVYNDTAAIAGESTNVADSLMQWARTITDDGYIIEFAMKWEAIQQGDETVPVGVGNVFGAVLQNHDNDNTAGTRDASVQWGAVLADAAWNTPKYLGTVQFLEDHKLQYIPTNNMTGVTNSIPYDGSDYDTAVEDDVVVAPTEFNLSQNYPNPFNPSTRINYTIAQQGRVKLIVYNMRGRKVATVVDRVQAAGRHQVTFDASHLSSGMYMYRLESGDKVMTKKLMLLK